jgi:hypothetical protein
MDPTPILKESALGHVAGARDAISLAKGPADFLWVSCTLKRVFSFSSGSVQVSAV